MIIIVLIVTFLTSIYYLLTLNFDYWKKRGVPGPKPRFIVGNVGESFLMRKSIGEVITDIYRKYDNLPIVGVFRSSTPNLLVRDPDLIKEIFVKSFNHFQDNDLDIDKNVDPLFGRNPFCLKGEEWKKVRPQLTPCFTGGKMKSIYPLIQATCNNLVRYINEQPEAFNGIGLEGKELCTKYTLDNVAVCAFGLEGKCFQDANCEFRRLANDFISPSGFSTFKIFLTMLIPVCQKFVNIKFIPKDVDDRLVRMVRATLKYREENNIVRMDFLHIINQLKGTSEYFTEIDVVAHAAGFFGDGYETSSLVLSFFLYNLAANPEVQEKLRAEVQEAFEENKGEIPYDVLQGLKYMDAALSESLRVHPPVFTLGKRCTQDYTFHPKPGDGISKPVTIEKDLNIIVPVYAFHNDPKYFEEPEKFIPERFLEENKDNITKFTYLPFGEGPRACLGQRFGLMQVKAGAAYILKNFRLSVNKTTRSPLKFDPTYLMISAVGGLWVDFEKLSGN